MAICIMMSKFSGQKSIQTNIWHRAITQIHAQVLVVTDGRDAILGRIELQANSTIGMTAQAIYVNESFGTMDICGKIIRNIMNDIKQIFNMI